MEDVLSVSVSALDISVAFAAIEIRFCCSERVVPIVVVIARLEVFLAALALFQNANDLEQLPTRFARARPVPRWIVVVVVVARIFFFFFFFFSL
tara:strand:- start:326 stop:607 length:282 start_codon:yes stop_codon:yes gene_type:complete